MTDNCYINHYRKIVLVATQNKMKGPVLKALREFLVYRKLKRKLRGTFYKGPLVLVGYSQPGPGHRTGRRFRPTFVLKKSGKSIIAQTIRLARRRRGKIYNILIVIVRMMIIVMMVVIKILNFPPS